MLQSINMKKIFKICLIIIGIIWIGFELFNFGVYLYYKKFKNGKICNIPMPYCYVGTYKPLTFQAIYAIFPTLDKNYCKDCNY